MVAHLEIGRYQSGFDSPVCLNASGANAHLLGYHNGRYRVLGETMDTGVGNALDKFTRHVGWTHPGGPKVEAAAEDGDYVELPYVVKGMDFSFSGIMSAAKDEADAVRIANDSPFGLGGSVFTADPKHGAEIAKQISTGMVFVNHPTMAKADLPFGGIGRSGYGRELVGLGIKEFVNVKAINIMG